MPDKKWSFAVNYSQKMKHWGWTEYLVLGGGALLLKQIFAPSRVGSTLTPYRPERAGATLTPYVGTVDILGASEQDRIDHFEKNKEALNVKIHTDMAFSSDERKKMEHALNIFLAEIKKGASSQEAGQRSAREYRKAKGRDQRVKETLLKLSLIDETIDS